MEKECLICKKYFKVKPSHFNKRICCSKNCQSQHYKTKQIGQNNPNYKGVLKQKRTCCICNKLFNRRGYADKDKTCGKECYLKLISKIHKGKTIPTHVVEKQKISHRKTLDATGRHFKGVCDCGSKKDPKAVYCMSCYKTIKQSFIKCIVCDRSFKFRSKNYTTCSKDCSKKRNSIFYTGDTNPNWRGGITPKNKLQRNSPEYKLFRETVFKRDNYSCVECKRTKCYIHAHHILPFSTHPELRFDATNGKTLCVECHKKYHPSMNIKSYKPQPSRS